MLPKTPTPVSKKWVIRLFSLIVTLAYLSSCSAVLRVEHASKLQEAQDLFNEAADMENTLKSEGMPESLTSPNNRIEAAYRTSHAMVSSLIQKQRTQLSQDDLLGTAYTLKAIIEWRLGEYAAANQTVREVDSMQVSVFPRDEALLAALPSLIQNDKAKHFMDMKSESFDTIVDLLSSSISDLDSVMQIAPSMNSMRLYLLTSQLAALKNWNDLLAQPNDYVTNPPSDNTLDALEESLCSEVTVPVWTSFTTEVKRLDSAGACNTYNFFFDLISPDACSAEVEDKENCDAKN